jgi:glycogen debranching enzyme
VNSETSDRYDSTSDGRISCHTTFGRSSRCPVAEGGTARPAAAVAFDFRMPELHSGDDAAEVSRPVPYPAACRPQAWSAAAAIPVWQALR